MNCLATYVAKLINLYCTACRDLVEFSLLKYCLLANVMLSK